MLRARGIRKPSCPSFAATLSEACKCNCPQPRSSSNVASMANISCHCVWSHYLIWSQTLGRIHVVVRNRALSRTRLSRPDRGTTDESQPQAVCFQSLLAIESAALYTSTPVLHPYRGGFEAPLLRNLACRHTRGYWKLETKKNRRRAVRSTA